MRPGSPRWEQINDSPFPHEQAGLDLLREYLPDANPYYVWANVEFVGTDGSINEIDALVLTPAGLYLLELKHWEGEVSGTGVQWVRRSRSGREEVWDNPLIATNRKARRLGSLLRHYARRGEQAPHVRAAVFLHARSTRSALDAVGSQHIYGVDGHERHSGLDSLRDFLTRPSSAIDASAGRRVVELVGRCGIRPSAQSRKIDGLTLGSIPFAEGRGWQDFLADHPRNTTIQRRIRIYLSSRAAETEAATIKRAAEREFGLLQGIHHPGVVRALNIVDHALGPAVIFDHERGSVRLDQWLAQKEKEGRQTIAQKLDLLDSLASTLEYAHSRRLAHRGLNPRAVLVVNPESGKPSLVITDWQAAGQLVSTTSFVTAHRPSQIDGIDPLADDYLRRYQAPEAPMTRDRSGVRLDVFGLGAIAYRIFTGQDPSAGPEDLRGRGLAITDAADAMPESLVKLIYEATQGDPKQRIKDIKTFRSGYPSVEAVWEEITAPERAPVIDPLEAKKGDVLDNGMEVLSRLGRGATSQALLVRDGSGQAARELVLKVALEERFDDRFAAEARALRRLNSPNIVALIGELTVGGRTALLMESAGQSTLAQDVQGGRLALDLLRRYGTDLLEIASYLDSVRIWHRDIKPANLAARPRPKDRELHLCAFDFSLTETPADNIAAGTRGYLDPFLGGAKRPRYDSDAERFAVAVTLYEMATGKLPSWEDANPATVTAEVTLEPEDFDRAYADALTAFFRRALARDARQRFDTTEQMAQAWREVFRHRQAEISPGRGSGLSRDSGLDATELSDGARSALEERLGVHTVGELLDLLPSALVAAKGITDAAKKEIRAELRRLRDLLPEQADPLEQERLARSVGLLSGRLTASIKDPGEANAIALLLGQQPIGEGEYLSWPTPREVEKAAGEPWPVISAWHLDRVKQWRRLADLKTLRDELVSTVESRGGVMGGVELAYAVLDSRGSTDTTARRLPQAIGLVRAAVEAELACGGDARLDHKRLPNGVVLIGREPGGGRTAAELLDYAARLGELAATLVAGAELPKRRESVEALRAVQVPDGVDGFEETRLLEVAAAASASAAVNAQGQLYPVGLGAETAMRLARQSLAGQVLTLDQLHERVRARFPRMEYLPGRPQLDRLLERCGVQLVWNGEKQKYHPPGTRLVTPSQKTPIAEAGVDQAEAEQARSRIENALRHKTFLAMFTGLRSLEAARQALLARFPLTEVNVTALLIRALRDTGIPWHLLEAADNGRLDDPDFRSLMDQVKHRVMLVIRQELESEKPLLLTEAAPLVRYGQLSLIAELADTGRALPGARLLLVPGGRPQPATMDKAQLPLTTPATQAMWLPVTWIGQHAAGPVAAERTHP